jgi:hypothetical protein
VLKGVLRDRLRADEKQLAADVFLDSAALRPIAGLVRAASRGRTGARSPVRAVFM